MSRTERLLDLLQIMRHYRYPVSGAVLAEKLGVSLRTLYRDIATLQAQGASIEGEAGVGYVLRPGYMLPPLMFTEEEIEALVLGTRWVAKRGDEPLAVAAREALAKISSVLPGPLRDELDAAGLLVGPGAPITQGGADLSVIRQAIRSRQKLLITYRDLKGDESSRTIWPFALAFFDQVRIVAAWCEARASFRHFRTDRIVALSLVGESYPRSRQALLKEWREREGIAPQ